MVLSENKCDCDAHDEIIPHGERRRERAWIENGVRREIILNAFQAPSFRSILNLYYSTFLTQASHDS
jgi:hypothetical protein